MKKSINRLLAAIAVLCLLCSMTITAAAAPTDDAVISHGTPCSITLYKYDLSSATADGVWNSSYVSTGVKDSGIETALREYAIEGVEFSYLKVADIVTFTERNDENGKETLTVLTLYGFNKQSTQSFLAALGLNNGAGSYAPAASSAALDQSNWYYTAETLNKALADKLSANSSEVKNALESFISENVGVDPAVAGKMPLTDENGYTTAGNLNTGLYLLVETRVPENVTATVDPFLLSLPMTSINGSNATDGGHRWIYDVTVYPKNQTGGVTLEKLVREDENEAFSHNTTASSSDIVTYQITSTLPTITSAATYLTEYTFSDILAPGITYTSDPVKIEWYTDRACTNLAATWNQGDGNFTVTDSETAAGNHNRVIAMTAAGFAKINAPAASTYTGFSNYTMRITYTAKLNSDNTVVYGDEANSNQVTLTWARTSDEYEDSLTDDCHVYSYGIVVYKTFSDTDNAAAEAAGLYDHVLFTLQNKTDGLYMKAELKEDEGIWYVTGTTEAEADATKMHPATWNNQDGCLVIKGLEAGEYILTEKETASGYTPLEESITIKIVAENDPDTACAPQAKTEHMLYSASASVNDQNIDMNNDETNPQSENALVPLRIENKRGFNLPQTGELGARLLPIIGGGLLGIVAIASVALFVFLRRKNKTA